LFENSLIRADTVTGMPEGQRSLSIAARFARWGIVAALFAVPASAAAVAGSPSGLSSRLAELAKPSVRMSSHAAQAATLGIAPQGPGSLLRKGNRVLAYVRFDHGAGAGLDALRAAGAEIASASRRYQTVTVAVKPADLTSVAAIHNVAGVTEALTPVAAVSKCPAGAVVSEGVKQLNAGEGLGEARKEFSVDGSGVTVGILSDSFNQATQAADGSGPVETTAADDAKSGDLPGTGNTCSGQGTSVSVIEAAKPEIGEEPADEGRAMAQIVHDLAPGANLDFASAFNGEDSFAKNIEKLATAGAEVIADDVFYFEEPFFQDGPVAVAVNKVVSGGATYFSAAGNDNLFDPEGHEIASWETPEFRDSGACPAEVKAISGANTTHCLDFNPDKTQTDRTFGIKVPPGGVLSVDLQWDEPWNGVETDLDAYLLDANGQLIAASGEDNIGISQKPLEVVQWENESSSQRTVQLAINRFSGESPRLKLGLLENGSGVAATEYPRSTGEDVVGPTIFGHSGTANAISVGAVPFDDSNAPEEYSSRGPVRHDFGPVEGGPEPAEELLSPEILSKPDLVATDCGLTTFFADFVPGEGWRFCGTSAAAPHAAGVAALMLDEKSGTPAQVRAAMQASALKVGAFGPCSAGAGLIDATGAIEDLLSASVPSLEECLTPEPEASVEEAQAAGNWGLETPPAPPPVTQVPGPSTPNPTVPRTFIRSHPAKLIRTRSRTVRVIFRFGSDESPVTFACRIDGGLFRPCHERLVRRFGIGMHSVRVIASDANGKGDRTPAVYRFRVKRIT
jgi:hypothetical protein